MTPWEQFKHDWAGKRVLIMGLGLQGGGAGNTKIFCQAGAKVTVTDLKTTDQLQESLDKLKKYNIKYVLGGHQEENFINTDIVIRNPDVAKSPFLDIARKANIPIKMDSSLFAKYCPWPIIGITGTRGKTTTTMMTYQVLKNYFKLQTTNNKTQVLLGGNVPGKATLELLKEININTGASGGIVVLELSSWELKGWHDEKISPHIAIFTNLSEDHLNRYLSIGEYFWDKTAIFKYQKKGDWLVANKKIEKEIEIEKQRNNIKSKITYFSAANLSSDFQLKIPGEHNRENAAAALAVGKILGIPEAKILEALQDFKGVSYRLETIATISGIDFINDTTSTTPIAAAAALQAITKPIILIAGGASKNLDPTPFVQKIIQGLQSGKIKKTVWLKGEGTSELLEAVQKFKIKNLKTCPEFAEGLKIPEIYDNFQNAVQKAYREANPGDAILLSPGCASFSMFNNEFDRGKQFNRIVKSLS